MYRSKPFNEILKSKTEFYTPKRVFAYCASQALGDYIMELTYAATIAKMLNDSDLTVLHPKDRTYRSFLPTLFGKHVTVIGLPAEQSIPINWFGIAQGEYAQSPYPWWYERLIHMPHLFLTPSMMCMPQHLPALVRAEIPHDQQSELHEKLIQRGADPDRWIVGMHLRESGYLDRTGPTYRNVDVSTYFDAIDYIYANGGQVIRVGDKSCTPIAPYKGVIDIIDETNDLPLQVYAYSKSRFILCADSGPLMIGYMQHVPVLATNCTGFPGWHSFDMLLNKTLVTKTGEKLTTSQQIQYEVDNGIEHPSAPFFLNKIFEEYIDNSPKQILDATKSMMEQTEDCLTWRTKYPETEKIIPQQTITWPVPPCPLKAQLIDLTPE